MKKRGVLQWIALLPVAALVLTGCSRGDDLVYPSTPVLPPAIGADGGIVEGFGGDVVLNIPAGALLEDVHFNMFEMTYKSGSEGCKLLRTFIIEPSVTFRKPATLKVFTDGCMSIGKDLCDEGEIYFYIWDNLTEYCNQTGQCCATCRYEMWSQSLSACIDKTGVIATVRKPF